MSKLLITQSNYIPWKGYFDNIAQSDVVVIYDDMQYTKRDWRNRNYIKTPFGPKWLTIPVEVKGKYLQRVNETVVSDRTWNIKHWDILKQNYQKAEFFSELSPWMEALYMSATYPTLTEINVLFLKSICSHLNINVEFRDSRDFDLVEGKTERLVAICKQLGATVYLTGPAAKNYMEEDFFARDGIKIEYTDYNGYTEYPQIYPPFSHGVSILDMLFNIGPDSRKYLNHLR